VQVNKHHHEPLKKKKEQDEKRRREQEIEMLVSAGQLPPSEQADFDAAPQISRVQTKESKPLPSSAVPSASPSIEEVEAPTVDLRQDEQLTLSTSEVIPNKEINQDAPPPSTEATVADVEATKSTNPSVPVPVPDDVVRAARAAPRLVPPFSAEGDIAVEEGRLAEDVDGVPKSRCGCVCLRWSFF
jgi:hypothetical protein